MTTPTSFSSNHGEWRVQPEFRDRHFLVVSPLGVVYRRYPTYPQARCAAEKMAAAMSGRAKRDLADPAAYRDPDTQRRLDQLLDELLRIAGEDHDLS